MIYNSERHQQSLDFAVNQVKASPVFPFVQSIILFGSCARKENKWASDVDMFLVLSPEIKNHEELRRALRFLQGTISPTDMDLPEVDLKIAIGDDWKRDGSFFHQQIIKEGIIIWDRTTTITHT